MISQTTKTALKFIIGGTIIVFGTILLVALARGWRIDFFSGRIDETGLMIINSDPGGGQITINNKLTKNKTPYRLENIDPGEVKVKLTKEGYRDWLRTAQVYAQEVTFNDFAWLLPNDLKVDTSAQNISPRTMITDEKNKKVAFSAVKPNQTLWYQSDIAQQPQAIYTPVVNPVAPLSSIQPIAFNSDTNQILIRENTTKTGYFYVVPINKDHPPVNVDTTFGVNPEIITFGPTNPADLFFTEKGVLRRLNLDNKTLSSVIADNVLLFTVGKDKIFYLQKTKLGTQLWSVDPNSLNKVKILDQVPVSTRYSLRANRSGGKDYLGLLVSDNADLYLYSDIYGTPKSSVIAKDATNFIFSPNGRYLSLSDNNKMQTVDLDQGRRYSFKTDLKDLSNWAWINDQHLIVVTGKTTRLIDYDGQNSQVLINNTRPGSGIAFGANKTLSVISEGPIDETGLTTISLSLTK